jgi:hypothetical protein
MFADLDNDLDLDVFLGSRNTQPRAFFNRLEETGSLAFRDMTAYVYSQDATSTGHYEQNLADLDNDWDLDAYLLNYNAGGAFGFNDNVAFNDATGRLLNFLTLSNSGADDNEPDFIDLENDGDLDLVVATFASTERIYVNAFIPSGSATFSAFPWASVAGTSLDVDVCDFDNDGDYDFGYAMDGGSSEKLFRNNLVQSGGPVDSWAPRLKRLEQAPNRSAGSAPTVLRTQAYDNSPLYVMGQQNDTRLVVTVDGCPMPDVSMSYSGGQVFRGAIPGSYVGNVAYFARSTDEHGNTGQSTTLGGAPETLSYASSGNKNATAFGTGTAGTGGLVPILDVNGPAAAGNAAFAFCVSSGLSGGPGFLAFSLLPVSPPLNIGVLVNVSPAALFFVPSITLDASGRKAFLLPVPPSTPAGGTVHVQFFGIDLGAPAALSSSNGLSVTTTAALP